MASFGRHLKYSMLYISCPQMARPEGRKKILHAGGDFHARSRVSLSSLSKRKKIAEVIGAHMVNNRFTTKMAMEESASER